MRKIFLLFLLSLVSISNIYAETVRMKVGDTKTLSPSVLLAYSGGYPFSISGDIRSVPS